MYKYLEIEETPGDESKVYLLNKIIKKNDTIILYHASWCGHCKTLMPTWNASTKKPMTLNDLNDSHLNNNFIIKIENSYKDILSGIEVGNSFPTIYMYKKGVKVDEFNKARTVSNLKAYFKKLLAKKKRGKSLKKSTKQRKSVKRKTKRIRGKTKRIRGKTKRIRRKNKN